MFNIIHYFRYKTKRLFSKHGEKTTNTVVKYDYKSNLYISNFKAFLKQRILSRVIHEDAKTFRTLYYMLGLSKNSKYTDITLKLTDYLSVQCVRIIVKLTEYKNVYALKENLMTDEIELPSFILDLVRGINCNYRIRPIIGSNSALCCKKVTITNDLSEDDKIGLEYIKVELLMVNKIFKLLNLDDIVKISNFEELYHSNDYDFSFYTRDLNKKGQIAVILGDNNSDEHTVAALLLRNEITNTEGLYQESDEYILDSNEALEILRTGNVAFSETQNYDEIKESFVVSEINSKLTKFGNVNIETSNIINPIQTKTGGVTEMNNEIVGED